METTAFNQSDIYIYPLTMDDMKLIADDNQEYHLIIEMTNRQNVPAPFSTVTEYHFHTDIGYNPIIFGSIILRYQSYGITTTKIGHFRFKTYYTEFNDDVKESIKRATIEIIKKEYANKLIDRI